jgi:hypothetical protein
MILVGRVDFRKGSDHLFDQGGCKSQLVFVELGSICEFGYFSNASNLVWIAKLLQHQTILVRKNCH